MKKEEDGRLPSSFFRIPRTRLSAKISELRKFFKGQNASEDNERKPPEMEKGKREYLSANFEFVFSK